MRARGSGTWPCGDLPVANPQPGVAAVHLDVHAPGGQRPVVEVPAVRMVERLGQLADHLDPRLDRPGGALLGAARACRAARALLGHELIQPLPLGAVPEDDRRTGLVLLAELLRLDDAL